MQTYISILRGINVSGHNLIKMNALQEICGTLGFRNVRTYIQSGNIVFETKTTDMMTLEKTISDAILKSFGFDIPVLVLEKEALKNIEDHNVFINERHEDHTKLHVTFLSDIPEKLLTDGIPHEGYLPDEFYIRGKSVYLFCPNGYGNTKLSNTFFEKKLKVRATTRNWKTIVELIKMSDWTTLKNEINC